MPITFYSNDNKQDREFNVMHRERLYERIRQNMKSRLIGVISDSGFGKSSLIQGFLSSEDLSFLWCAFSSADTLDTLLKEIHEAFDDNGDIDAIVFDNCALVANEAGFANAIADISNMSPNTTIFMLGTALPKLPFAVMRAKDQYFELTYMDLMLDRDETESYFNDFLSFNLKPYEIDIIYDKTHGWFTSLQLINAYLIKNNMETLDLNFLSDVSDINDYFSYNLFENQSTEMQQFLIEISPVTELDPDVINQLLNIDNADSYLDELREYHGFAYVTASTKQLKLHPLFRQYLYERYMSHAASECRAAHNRLISIYERKRNYTQAFSHAVACNNYEASNRLMAKLSDRYNPIQLMNIIDGHLESISPALLFSNTSLFLQRCIPESLTVELIQPLTDAMNHEYDSLRLANLQHRLGVLYFHLGNIDLAKNLIEKSLNNSEKLRHTEVMAFNYQLLADCYLFMDDTAQALRCARNALYLSEQNNIPVLQMHTLEVFSRIQLALGNVDSADDYITQAIELAPPDSYELFWFYVVRSRIDILQGLADDALSHATKAVQLVANSNSNFDIAYTNLALARALVNAGKLNDAQECIETAYKNSSYNEPLRLEILTLKLELEKDDGARSSIEDERAKLIEDASDLAVNQKNGPSIVITTFDTFDVSCNSIPITIKRSASLKLLQLLIVNRGRFVNKEYIIEQLFTGSSASAGLNNFNVALSVLRKSMDAAAGITSNGESCILREKDRYKLNEERVSIDASAFEAKYMKLKRNNSLDLKSWLELSALYSGDFMSEYPYESFLISERERLMAFQKDVALTIARAYVQRGDINKSLTYYNQFLAIDAYDEDVYYEIIEMLLDNDLLSKAQAIAEKMVISIEDELGVPCSKNLDSMFEYYKKVK